MENGYKTLTAADLNTFGVTQLEEFGALGKTKDGRTFQYTKFGGTSAISAGLVCTGPAAPANSTGLAITAVGTGGQATGNLVANSRTLVLD